MEVFACRAHRFLINFRHLITLVSAARWCIRCLRSCFWCSARCWPGRRILWRSASGGDRSWTLSRGLLPFAQGIPSHDTLNDVMNALDGGLFSGAFTAWGEGLREDEPDIVAIDGKT